jgi:hypothetical protein
MNIITTEEHLHYVVVIGVGRMFQYVEGTVLTYLLHGAESSSGL